MSFEKKKILAIAGAAVILIAAVAVSYATGYSHGYNSRGKTQLQDNNPDSVLAENELDENEVKPLDEDTISVLCCGVDNTQKLTDVIMYALFDTREGTVNILRIPRDTFVGSAFPTGKANAIYGHPKDGMTGIETLRNYLEENWKLDIDYYATIDLAGVRDIVDDIGGVTMNIEQQINYLPGKVLYPGEQTLNGEQAEWILRYRSGYANGDLGRIDAQTAFIKAAIQQVKDMGRMKCIPILMKHYNDVDTDMPLDKMVAVAGNLFELNVDDMVMHVVPGKGTMYYSYAVYAVDIEGLVEILNESFARDGQSFSAESLDIPNLYGGSSVSKPSSGFQSNSYQGGSTSSQTQQSSQTTQKPGNSSQQNSEDQEQMTPQYLYDENGNPLYRLDQNGDPIYDYDEDGNIVYIYEQTKKQEEKTTQKQSQTTEKTEKTQKEQSDSQSTTTTQREDGRKVIPSKSNQEKAQQEQEQEESKTEEKTESKTSSSKTTSKKTSSGSDEDSEPEGFHFTTRG